MPLTGQYVPSLERHAHDLLMTAPNEAASCSLFIFFCFLFFCLGCFFSAQLKAAFREIFHSTWEADGDNTKDVTENHAGNDDPAQHRGDTVDQSEQPSNESDQSDSDDDDADDDADERPPVGVERLQKASAWYVVSHSPDTNPYVKTVRTWDAKMSRAWPPCMFLSFPWVAAHDHLCEIKRVKLAQAAAAADNS